MANLQLVCDGTPGLCAGFQLAAQDSTGASQPASGTPTQKAVAVVITNGPNRGTGSALTDPGAASISVSLT